MQMQDMSGKPIITTYQTDTELGRGNWLRENVSRIPALGCPIYLACKCQLHTAAHSVPVAAEQSPMQASSMLIAVIGPGVLHYVVSQIRFVTACEQTATSAQWGKRLRQSTCHSTWPTC